MTPAGWPKCSDNEHLGHLTKGPVGATSMLSMSSSLSAVDMNQLCLGWTKTPRAAHSAAHASVKVAEHYW